MINDHLSEATMNDLVDGLLPAAEVTSARAHMDDCAVCREAYARLSDTVRQLRALPRSGDAPEAAWPAIEARIGSAGGTPPPATEDGRAKVVPLRGSGPTPWRVTLSVPQLAAAALVVSILSATAVWLALPQGAASPASVAAEDPASPRRVLPVSAETADKVAGYNATITGLEEILERGRVLLSRETLVTLETSLETIDEAIQEVQAALERDPASELLLRVLMTHQRTKLQVLRQAATSLHFRG